MNEFSESKPQEGKEKLVKRILLADDEEQIRTLSARLLASIGCVVETVENGQQLLDKLATGEYDLVVTDNNMPVMTGIQALAQIRADDRLKNLPVVVNSGDEMGQTKIDVLKLSGTYLKKPYNPREFIETVKQALAK